MNSLVTALLRAASSQIRFQSDAQRYHEMMTRKRRKRPLLGRGNYGKNLMAHFARKRLATIQAKKLKGE